MITVCGRHPVKQQVSLDREAHRDADSSPSSSLRTSDNWTRAFQCYSGRSSGVPSRVGRPQYARLPRLLALLCRFSPLSHSHSCLRHKRSSVALLGQPNRRRFPPASLFNIGPSGSGAVETGRQLPMVYDRDDLGAAKWRVPSTLGPFSPEDMPPDPRVFVFRLMVRAACP